MTLPEGGARLRVVLGPHDAMFTAEAIGTLLGSRFTVTPQSNRMGYRLEGPAVLHLGPADILSDATPIGSLQVPASGQPILLMADRQTTGGYPKIATVITADLPLAGQLAPGDWIQFTRVRGLSRSRRSPRRKSRCRAIPCRRRSMSEIDVRLREAFGDGRVRRDVRLGPLTTFKVGGPADWLLDLHGSDELRLAVRIARDAAMPVTVLGGGSNVLIADDGIRGLVIRVHGGEVSARGPAAVRADAGVTINGLVRWTINHGVAGLEAWAGTPGTVGGAVFGNAHFQGRLISELVERVMLVTPAGDLADVPAGDMEFGYDFSRLHRTREIVVSADFRVGTRRARRASRDRAGVARVPEADAAARVVERRLHLPEPGSGDRSGARGDSAVRGGAGRSRRD